MNSTGSAFTPAGYMSKRIQSVPDWLGVSGVSDIYSVSNCVSDAFCDYIPHWRHNGYWLFDSPESIHEIAALEKFDQDCLTMFYYEVYDCQFDVDRMAWETFAVDPAFVTEVQVPAHRQLAGYDVVSFSSGSAPECSPLSCNRLAANFDVNAHCLLNTFEQATQMLESDVLRNCEPGPYRIFAIYMLA